MFVLAREREWFAFGFSMVVEITLVALDERFGYIAGFGCAAFDGREQEVPGTNGAVDAFNYKQWKVTVRGEKVKLRGLDS